MPGAVEASSERQIRPPHTQDPASTSGSVSGGQAITSIAEIPASAAQQTRDGPSRHGHPASGDTGKLVAGPGDAARKEANANGFLPFSSVIPGTRDKGSNGSVKTAEEGFMTASSALSTDPSPTATYHSAFTTASSALSAHNSAASAHNSGGPLPTRRPQLTAQPPRRSAQLSGLRAGQADSSPASFAFGVPGREVASPIPLRGLGAGGVLPASRVLDTEDHDVSTASTAFSLSLGPDLEIQPDLGPGGPRPQQPRASESKALKHAGMARAKPSALADENLNSQVRPVELSQVGLRGVHHLSSESAPVLHRPSRLQRKLKGLEFFGNSLSCGTRFFP